MSETNQLTRRADAPCDTCGEWRALLVEVHCPSFWHMICDGCLADALRLTPGGTLRPPERPETGP